MESGAEEHELNGDLRPDFPGSPDASVRSQHPRPRPLCDLGRRRPLWARLSSGHLWVSGRVCARPHCGVVVVAAAPGQKSCLTCPESKWWVWGQHSRWAEAPGGLACCRRPAVQSPRLAGTTPRVEVVGIPLSRTLLPPTPPSNFQRLGAVSCVPWGGRERESPPPGWKPAPGRQLRHHTVTTQSHAAVIGETRGCAPAAVTYLPMKNRTSPSQPSGCPL